MRLKKLISGAIAAAMSMAMLTMLPAKAAATDCTDTWVTNADGTYSFTASGGDLDTNAKILDLSRFDGDSDVIVTVSANGNFGGFLGANDIVNGWKQEEFNLGNETKTFTVSAGEEGIDYLKIELLWITEGTTVTVEARVDETLDTWVIKPNGTYSFTASKYLGGSDLNEDAKIIDLSRFAGDKDVTITMSGNGYFIGGLGANDIVNGWKQEMINLGNETKTFTMSAGEKGINYLKIELWEIEEGTTVTVDARVGETYVQLNTSKEAETGLYDERAIIELDETLVEKIDYVNFNFEGDLYDTVNNTITGTYNKTIKCTKYYTGIRAGDTVYTPAPGRVFVIATLKNIPRSKVPNNIPFTYELHYAA